MATKYFKELFLVIISFLFLVGCNDKAPKMTIKRAIVSSDAKPYYLDFWPIAAAGWKRLGIRPTLILIGDSSVQVDESIGDVIRFEPLPDVDVAMQAQVIRLFAPAFYPDEVSITSDIDMLPVSKTYFHDSVKDKPEDNFVVFRKNAYPDQDRYAMCYNAALGRTFAEIFQISDPKVDIPVRLREWSAKNLGWGTDELVMTPMVQKWGKKTGRLSFGIDFGAERRLDRLDWKVDPADIAKGNYVDAHMPRPYKDHKDSIDKLLKELEKNP